MITDGMMYGLAAVSVGISVSFLLFLFWQMFFLD